MKIIENERFGEERALYHLCDATVKNCRFEGPEDGESAMKEARSVAVESCFMDLRYPLWHVTGLSMRDCRMTEKCRAALWYDENVTIENCDLGGIKALRECRDIRISDTAIVSPEFGWHTYGLSMKNVSVTAEYAFLGSHDIRAENLTFNGKYSFQYTENVEIDGGTFNTKDAFWHAKNVTVRNATVNGEYLAWYSENLTLENCTIRGTQPFCYCRGLRLINCVMEDCDLAFEYSDVEADVHSHVVSIKNPRSGKIVVDSVGEIIRGDNVYPCDGIVEIR